MYEMKFVSEFHIAADADTTNGWSDLGGSFQGIPQSLPYAGLTLTFTRNLNGTVGMCKISGSDVTWSQWGGNLVAPPGVAPSPNGAIAVVGRMQDGQYQLSYVNPLQGTYTAWTGFANGGSQEGWAGTPVLAVNQTQSVEVFSLDSAGVMWRTWQETTSTDITWVNWQPVGTPSGTTFSIDASIFTVFLSPSTEQLQAVALGSDYKMYQSNLSVVGQDPSSAWSVIGYDGDDLELINGPAVAFPANSQNPAYAAYNQKNLQLLNPLVYSAPPTFTAWGSLNLTEEQFPVSTQAPVMVSNQGILQLAWLSLNTPGQMMFVSQSSTPDFWNSVVNLGAVNSQLTGAMSGFASSGALSLFQLGSDSQLYYINYQPED